MSDSISQSRPPRTKKSRRWTIRRILLAIVLFLAAGVLLSALIPTSRWIEARGYVMTDKEAEIRPSVEGAIAEQLVRSGDTVSKGQVLVRLKASVHKAAMDRAGSELNVAQARIKQLEEHQKLAEAQRGQQVFRAKRNLVMLTDKLAKMEASKGGVFSAHEISEARLKVEIATSRLAELELPRRKAMENEIAVLRRQLEAARKAIVLHEAEIELRQIRSTQNGTVEFNNFEPGEVVKPQHVLGQVFDRSAWIVRLKLPERAIAHVRQGQPVRIELAAYSSWRGEYLSGRVSRLTCVVTPQATGDGIIYVEAAIENPPAEKLNPGMQVRARINAGRTTWLLRLLGW